MMIFFIYKYAKRSVCHRPWIVPKYLEAKKVKFCEPQTKRLILGRGIKQYVPQDFENYYGT